MVELVFRSRFVCHVPFKKDPGFALTLGPLISELSILTSLVSSLSLLVDNPPAVGLMQDVENQGSWSRERGRGLGKVRVSGDVSSA